MSSSVASTTAPVSVTLREPLAPASLFPLPLTAFEHYMWVDDRPAYPMTFLVELELSGRVDEQALEWAWLGALARHPLLTASIHQSGPRAHWVPAPHAPRLHWCSPGDTSAGTRNTWIDLRSEPGLIAWAIPREYGARVVVQFHHAACDGLGSIQFVGDLLALYGQQTARPGQAIPRLLPSSPEKLQLRGEMWRPGRRPRGIVWRIIRRTYEILGRPSAVVAGGTPETVRNAAEPLCGNGQSSFHQSPYVTRMLPSSDVAHIRARARSLNVTDNEIYLCAWLQSLAEWNLERGARPGRELLRIGVPVSLRSPRNRDASAANIVSYVFASRHAASLNDSRSVLDYLHEKTRLALHDVDGRLFLYLTAIGKRFPWLMSPWSRPGWGFCTAILTNLRDVKRQFRARFPMEDGKCVAGSLRLESILGAACIRPGTRIAVAVGTYAGQLHINFNYDRNHLCRQDVEDLGDRLVQRILDLISEPKASKLGNR